MRTPYGAPATPANPLFDTYTSSAVARICASRLALLLAALATTEAATSALVLPARSPKRLGKTDESQVARLVAVGPPLRLLTSFCPSLPFHQPSVVVVLL